MLYLEFTTQEIHLLHYESFHHPHPRVQLKMEALYLKSQSLSHKQICQLTAVSGNTLRSYLKQYKTGGIDALKELNFYRPQSLLDSHASSIEEYFQNNPVATINQARAVIKEQTGITRSPTQIANFLHRIGIERRKLGMIPAKADVVAQAEFLDNQLQPRLDEAKNGIRILYFIDAAHFVLSPFLGFLWSFTRIFLPAPSGRQRFNVLGAINAITKQIEVVTNQTYITSLEVCELLTLLAAQSVDLPITVVLDNARYQRCQLVMACAERLGIELLFLPAYSPNLNLIERLWKFVKKQCLYSRYYDKFEKFKAAITECLETANTKHQKELDSLLTLKFQTFDKAQFMTV